MLYYKKFEKKEPCDWVVFIHGAGGSSSIWFKQVRAYQEHFNVLLVDLRGHGKSKEMSTMKSYYKEKYTFKTVSRDVLEVLKRNNINSAHFVGVSLGTIIIRSIAEIKPEVVKSAVMCGAITRLDIRSRVLVWLGQSPGIAQYVYQRCKKSCQKRIFKMVSTNLRCKSAFEVFQRKRNEKSYIVRDGQRRSYVPPSC